MTTPLPCPSDLPAGLPPASEEALRLTRACVHLTPLLGAVRIAYRPPGTAPGGPDLLYRAATQAHRADAEADYLVRLLAPLVDLGLGRGRAEAVGIMRQEFRALRERGPDGPGDALDHRHDPPRLGMAVIVGDEGEAV